MPEARGAQRYPVQLPVRIAGASSARGQIAVSDNVSAAGIYIRTKTKFTVGAHVQMEITLPAEVIGTRKPVKVRCQGRVIRTDVASDKTTGLACIIDRYRFIRSGAQA